MAELIKSSENDWPQAEGKVSGFIPLFLELQIAYQIDACFCYLFLLYICFRILDGKESKEDFCEREDQKKLKACKSETECQNLLRSNTFAQDLTILRKSKSLSNLLSLSINHKPYTDSPGNSRKLKADLGFACRGALKADDGGNQTSGNQQSGKNQQCDPDFRQTASQGTSCNAMGATGGAGNDGDDDDDDEEKRKKQRNMSSPKDYDNFIEEEAPEEDEACTSERKSLEVPSSAQEIKIFVGPLCLDEAMEVSSNSVSNEEVPVKDMDVDNMDVNPWLSTQDDCSMPSDELHGANEPVGETQQARTWQDEQLSLRETLGEGSFGTCILVEGKKSGRLMAIKEISQLKFKHEEVAILSKLKDSHHVILFHGMQKNENMFTLFFEFAQGGTLKMFFKEPNGSHRGDLKTATFFFHEIMQGVAYIHGKGIIHSDIKGENILIVSRNGGHYRPVLGDFGLSIDKSSLEYITGNLRNRGTTQYMSPEMIRLNAINSFATDVWSCGCVLIDMDTGDPPWKEAHSRGEPCLIYTIGSATKPPIPSGASHALIPFYQATLQLDHRDRLSAKQIIEMSWND